MTRSSRRAFLAAWTALSLAACADLKPSQATIPAAFHGTWAPDRAACENPNEVKMVIGPEGYSREEIAATATRVEPVADQPPRLRVEFDARAEGMGWSEAEEWLLSDTGEELVLITAPRAGLTADESAYVRCASRSIAR